MVFSSATFLFFFFPCFLAAYYFLPWKNAVLLAASLLFYAWGEARFVPLLMLSAVLNYAFGRRIGAAAARSARRRHWLWAGVLANLALLTYFKYAGFLASSANALGGAVGMPAIDVPAIALPLGISFFTFQGISYLVDIYRGEIDAQKSFLRFAMYKAMFPQLIAGPIVRYSQIAGEIERRVISNERLLRGLMQFMIGLAQKVLVANSVAVPADRLFAAAPADLSPGAAWLGIVCYAIQILYDFAGYSNMAIGIGHMIGFSYPPNFRQPYSAGSLTEFWRRWHISLSSWFRDYVYVPLGGNRAGPLRTYLNLALVFFLCGLWHGAAWTFVLWGLWHGLFLVLERSGLGRALERLPRALAQGYMLAVVLVGWVLFRADNVPHALAYLRAMAGWQQVAPYAHQWQLDAGWSALAALSVGSWLALRRERAVPARGAAGGATAHAAGGGALLTPWRAGGAVLLFLLSVASLASGTYNPFIYFRF